MIGVLGGTFNPIHNGHLRIALEVLELCELEHVRLIPSAVPPHRPQPEVSSEQRLAMVRLAAEHESRFVVDDCELQRMGESYTVDTLIRLKQQLPEQSIVFIMGMDAFAHFQSWYRWEEILTLCHIVVVHRPQYVEQPEWCQSRLLLNTAALRQKCAGGVLYLPVTALDISATFIRSQINQNKSPRYLIPESVWQYIHTHHLYS